MRHAKSSWDNPNSTDHDRVLNDRGLSDTPRMAGWLIEETIVPDTIISSTALRAKETAEILVSNFEDTVDLKTEGSLYHSSPHTILSTAKEFPIGCEIGMIVAHNPGMGELASHFSKEWNNFPTAGIAVIRFTIDDWSAIQQNTNYEFITIMTPKRLSNLNS